MTVLPLSENETPSPSAPALWFKKPKSLEAQISLNGPEQPYLGPPCSCRRPGDSTSARPGPLLPHTGLCGGRARARPCALPGWLGGPAYACSHVSWSGAAEGAPCQPGPAQAWWVCVPLPVGHNCGCRVFLPPLRWGERVCCAEPGNAAKKTSLNSKAGAGSKKS